MTQRLHDELFETSGLNAQLSKGPAIVGRKHVLHDLVREPQLGIALPYHKPVPHPAEDGFAGHRRSGIDGPGWVIGSVDSFPSPNSSRIVLFLPSYEKSSGRIVSLAHVLTHPLMEEPLPLIFRTALGNLFNVKLLGPESDPFPTREIKALLPFFSLRHDWKFEIMPAGIVGYPDDHCIVVQPIPNKAYTRPISKSGHEGLEKPDHLLLSSLGSPYAFLVLQIVDESKIGPGVQVLSPADRLPGAQGGDTDAIIKDNPTLAPGGTLQSAK